MKVPVCVFVSSLLVTSALAEQALRPAASDSRILLATYRDSEIYKVVASYGFQTTLEFSDKESVETISIGDSIAWQVVPAGHRVFLKPQEPNAMTNMTVVTTLRAYHFDLGAKKDSSPSNVTFLVRFTYPDARSSILSQRISAPSTVSSGKKPTDYNFNYTLSGSREIAPVRVFDDGEFTYMQFKALTDLPAIFLVNKSKQESVVNYRVEGQYVVIERLGSQFSLRHGSEVACVYNRSAPTVSAEASSSPPTRNPDADARSQ